MDNEKLTQLEAELNDLTHGQQSNTVHSIVELIASIAGKNGRQFIVSYEPGAIKTNDGVVDCAELASQMASALTKGHSVAHPRDRFTVKSHNDCEFDNLFDLVEQGRGCEATGTPAYHDLDDDCIVGYSIITAGDVRNLRMKPGDCK